MVVPHQQVNAVVEDGPRALERAARNHVDRAGQRHAGRLGRGRVEHLDAGDIVERNLIEQDVARGGRAGGPGEIEAADGDRHVAVGDAVHGELARLATGDVNGHARKVFEELAHIAVGDRAELLGGDDVLDARGEALLVDCDRRAVHFLRRGDDEFSELHNVARRPGSGPARAGLEVEVALRRGAAGHGHRFRLHIEPGEKHAHPRGTGGDVGEAVLPAGVGEGLEAGALDGDARPFEIFAVAQIQHAALDGAGGDGLGGGGSRGEHGERNYESHATNRNEKRGGIHRGRPQSVRPTAARSKSESPLSVLRTDFFGWDFGPAGGGARTSRGAGGSPRAPAAPSPR